MRKKLVFMAIPALLPVLGLVLAGCDTPTGGGGGELNIQPGQGVL